MSEIEKILHETIQVYKVNWQLSLEIVEPYPTCSSLDKVLLGFKVPQPVIFVGLVVVTGIHFSTLYNLVCISTCFSI